MRRALALLLCLPAACFSDEFYDLIKVGIGKYDFHQPKYRSDEYTLEYRRNLFWPNFRGFLCYSSTHHASMFWSVGMSYDIPLGKHFYVSPFFGPGLFMRGGGKDLGLVFQFRSGAEFSLNLPHRYRLGLQIHHTSNAHFGSKNPGQESLLITFSIPLRVREKKRASSWKELRW